MSNLLGLAGRRRLLSTNTIRYYSTVDSEPPRRSNKWLIIGSTALLGAVAYRYIEAQRRETERANAGGYPNSWFIEQTRYTKQIIVIS